ncbi:hypothetical protein B0H14DRAFT_1693915 [Mycena olivaceomarginata]|nr:hypothetical protein B0H14DRAFT_1693915 [Mycena olivaceomarginata]
MPYGYWAPPPPQQHPGDGGKDGPGAGDSGGGYRVGNGWGHQAGWWAPPQQVQPQAQQVQVQAQGTQQGEGAQRQQSAPPREDLPSPPQERPPPPAESGAVSMAASLSALGDRGARGGAGMVFGSVDAAQSGAGSPPPGAGLPSSVVATAAGLPPSATMAAVASSSTGPPPPPLPTSVSAPAPAPAWRAPEEVIWPTDPAYPAAWRDGNWAGAESILKRISSSTGSAKSVLAIGVSPRARARRLEDEPGTEVVDVTVAPEALAGRWEFGTTREAERRGAWAAYGAGAGMGVGYGYGYDGAQMYGAYGYPPAPPPPMGDGMMPQGMMPPMGMGMGPPPPQMMGMGGMGMYGMPPPPPAGQMQGMLPPANGAPMEGESGPPSSSVSGPVNGNGNGNAGGERSEWEVAPVKDYGYFTGGYGREERNAYVSRGPPREVEQSHQDERPPRDDYPVGRSRRGSYNGGAYGYEPRGGYGGRRGRGFRGGYGRYGRGGFQQQTRGPPPTQQQPPPFSITPPPHFTPLVPEGYYPTPYMPTSYDYAQAAPQHLAPVPTLRTRLSFPIDRLRQEILSQLEFYLSPDNMATDLYLRQQMDSQGWVRIDVLASFKRVQAKTSDVSLVRDVLGLSDYAEIRGEWVRSTEGWEQFVLPTAQPSVVDQETQTPHSLLMHGDKPGYSPAGDVEELDDEDEEDVVFVMGREAQAWSPERPR